MMTQTEIAKYFKAKYGTKMHQVRVSRLLKGKEQVSWPFACDLSQEFPGRTIQQWKNATPEDLAHAFAQLKPAKEGAA
jgi:plasmid maintenance system antidote protein VapI